MFPILVTNLWWWLTQYLRHRSSNARPQKRVRLSFSVLSKVFFELPDLTWITFDFNEFVTFFVDQQFTLWPGFCVLNFLSFTKIYLLSEKQIQNKLRNFEKFQFLNGKIDQSTNFDKSSSCQMFFCILTVNFRILKDKFCETA